MKEIERNLPFVIAKPYSGQYLELLLETISKNGLQPHSIYGTDRWGDVARQIYQKNVDRIGRKFKVGLEGHIRLVNFLFGNRAVVLFLEGSGNTNMDLQEALSLTQEVKRNLRTQAPGGERLEDIIVFMNLKQVDIGCDPEGICPTGIIGIKNDSGEFKAISKTSGTWDFYYFKYVHVPDNIEDLHEELTTLDKMGVLDPKNEIAVQDFLVMAKLQTLVPLDLIRKAP